MKASLLAAVVVLLASIIPSRGTITVVTGGDAGEGFAPQPFTLAAINYGSGAAATCRESPSH